MTDATGETLPPAPPQHTALPAPLAEMTDGQKLDRILLIVDHLDPMVHRLDQLAGRLEPILERWGAYLGSPVRDYLAAKKAARKGGGNGG